MYFINSFRSLIYIHIEHRTCLIDLLAEKHEIWTVDTYFDIGTYSEGVFWNSTPKRTKKEDNYNYNIIY